MADGLTVPFALAAGLSGAVDTTRIITHAPGNGAPIGGVKVVAEHGWFAARPSGTEPIYRLYAESLRGADHLHRILEEAQAIVSEAVVAAGQRGSGVA